MSAAKILEHTKNDVVKLFQMNLEMQMLVFLNSDIVMCIYCHYWAEVSMLGITAEVWIHFNICCISWELALHSAVFCLPWLLLTIVKPCFWSGIICCVFKAFL